MLGFWEFMSLFFCIFIIAMFMLYLHLWSKMISGDGVI